MPVLTCNSCNREFEGEEEQKLHYRSEWHRYNLKRKVAGVPGVTEALFQAKISALAEEKNKLNAVPLTYSCTLCGKEYRSLKAHDQHIKSRSHILRVSQESNSAANVTVIKPATSRQISRPIAANKRPVLRQENEEDDEDDEWEEVDSDTVDGTSEALVDMHMGDLAVMDEDNEDVMDEDNEEILDPTNCFICDQEHEGIEACMVHMHKQHGFFIPDIEYLKDPKGFLTYVGLKVKRDFMCLYCNDRCQPFQSLEAVRMHMIAKSHCKVHYGDGGEDEEVELEEFYDYSSSYVDADGKQLVASDDIANGFELGAGGSELVITKRGDRTTSVVTLGSREFLRYYRQKPRPSPARDVALAISLASRYRSMGLATVQSKEQIVRMKVWRAMNRSGVEAMRTKVGLRNNKIRNLPNNVPY